MSNLNITGNVIQSEKRKWPCSLSSRSKSIGCAPGFLVDEGVVIITSKDLLGLDDVVVLDERVGQRVPSPLVHAVPHVVVVEEHEGLCRDDAHHDVVSGTPPAHISSYTYKCHFTNCTNGILKVLSIHKKSELLNSLKLAVYLFIMLKELLKA